MQQITYGELIKHAFYTGLKSFAIVENKTVS